MTTPEFQYLDATQTGKLFDLLLQLGSELHTTRRRLQVLEASLIRDHNLAPDALETFVPEQEQQAAWDADLAAFSSRLMRVIAEAGPAEQPMREQWLRQAAPPPAR